MKEYLENIRLFSQEEIAYFLSYCKEVSLFKDDFFIREGEVAKRIAFIKSGLFRSFYYSTKSDEVTYCFSFPNELIAGYSSIITQEKTKENIQALTNCNLVEFPKHIFDEMVENNKNWLLYSKLVAESQYVKLEKRIFSLQKENALTRYKELIKNHPEYLQKIPLGHLASYLGISQRHLSRLRKQISF